MTSWGQQDHLSKHCTSLGLLMPPTNWMVSPKVEKHARFSYLQLGSTGTDTLTTGTLHQHTHMIRSLLDCNPPEGLKNVISSLHGLALALHVLSPNC